MELSTIKDYAQLSIENTYGKEYYTIGQYDL